MTEKLDYSLVGTWTMENAGAIALNFDCINNDVFKQLLTTFIAAANLENDDSNRIDDSLGQLFISLLAHHKLR